MQARPGFQVELMAAEPLVRDPIAMAWGPDGRLWVVEMGDYPRGVDGKGGQGGVVRFLEDTDGDGRYDRSTVFLDELGFPTGVAPWRNGVLVTCAPTSLCRGHRRRRPGRQARGSLPRLSRGEPAASHERAEVGSRRLALWRPRRRGRRQDRAAQSRRHGECQRPRLSHPARRRPARSAVRPFAIRPQPRRLGQLVRQYQQRADVPVRARRRLPAPQQARGRDRRPRPGFRESRRRRSLSPQPHAGPLQRLVRGQSLHLGQQHDRLSRRSFRPGLRGQRVHQRAGAQPGASRDHAARRADVRQPPRRRREAERISGLGRQLVPPHDAGRRTRRRAVGGRHVSPDDRASRVDSPGNSKAARPAGRRRHGAHLSRLSGGQAPRKRPRLDKLSTAELVAALDSPSGWQRDMAQQLLVWRGDKTATEPLEALAAKITTPRLPHAGAVDAGTAGRASSAS